MLSRVSLSVAALGVVVIMLLAACAGDSRHPAERAVAQYYVGLSSGDTDAVMDAVEPADRNRTGMGLLNILDAVSVSIGWIGLDLGKLTAFSIRELRLDILTESSEYALVRARGDIRYTTLGLEVPFCDMHDVRRASDGKWYMDLDATERLARLERIVPQRQAELMTRLESTDESVTGILGAMTDTMALIMNLCE